MSRKHQIQGQSVFLHRMLFKVANEASAALFISRLFAVWILQHPVASRGWGWGSLPFPASPSPAGCLIPVCPSHSPAQTPAAGGKPEQGQNGTGCNEKRQSIQPVAARPSPRRFAPAHEDTIPLALSLSPRCVPSCPPRAWPGQPAQRDVPLSSTLQDRFLFSCWQEGPETLQKWFSRSDRCCPHLCVYPCVPVLPGAG